MNGKSLSGLFEAKRIKISNHFQNRLGTVLVTANHAPSGDQNLCFSNRLEDISIIFRTDRILDGVQSFWIGGNQCEDVGHDETIKSPGGAERSNPAGRSIQGFLACDARIASDPGTEFRSKERLPSVFKEVSVSPIRAEDALVLHVPEGCRSFNFAKRNTNKTVLTN